MWCEVGKDPTGSYKSLRAEKEGGLESDWCTNFVDGNTLEKGSHFLERSHTVGVVGKGHYAFLINQEATRKHDACSDFP